MIPSSRLSIVFVVLASEAFGGEQLLTIGSDAPEFKGGEVVQGPALTELSSGTVYVIEFSGTYCAPCIEMIPHMEELHRAHPDVSFLAVFSEPVEDVRRFLHEHGKAMTMPVVADAEGVLWRSWTDAAAYVGIPHVFVVDAEGKIAWIGHPGDLGDQLAAIIGGESIGSVESMRIRIEQQAVLTEREAGRRAEVAREYNNSFVSSLIQEGKLEEAIQALDVGIKTYADLPNLVSPFRARKLFLLGRVPDRHEEAFALALEIAVDGRMRGDSDLRAAVNYVLNHYERADPENRDERMLAVALALIKAAVVPDDNSIRSLGERAYHFLTISRAYHLSGDSKQATEALTQGVAALEAQLQRMRADMSEELEVDEVETTLAKYRDRLAAYQSD